MGNFPKKIKWGLVAAGSFLVVLLTAFFMMPAETHITEGSAAGPTPTNTPTPVTVELYAEYQGGEVVIGDEFDESKLYVYATYKSGVTERVTDDYRLSGTVVTKIGENKFGVYYHGRSAEFVVIGRDELKVVEIIATYMGDGVIVSNEINKNDVEVWAYYNWPEKGPQKLSSTAFTLTPSKVTKVGRNEILVKYEDVKTTIEVWGLEKEIVNVECKYIGKDAVVGSKLTTADFQLKVTYNDKSTEIIEKFHITNPKIVDEGDNIIVITWRDYVFEVTVTGIPKSILSQIFDDLPETDASSIIILVVSNEMRAKTIEVLPVDAYKIKDGVDRVVVTEKYIGYELTYTDPECYLEFPILTRIVRPQDYDPEKFAVYYTPNRRTIMAKLNGEYLDEAKTQYAFYMHEPGTYVMLEEISSKLVTSINFENHYITMKADRTYSLEPVVMPLSAENKEVTYWSSDEWVCTVSETGKITSYNPGTCEIWVEAKDGSGVYEVVYVTVKEK